MDHSTVPTVSHAEFWYSDVAAAFTVTNSIVRDNGGDGATSRSHRNRYDNPAGTAFGNGRDGVNISPPVSLVLATKYLHQQRWLRSRVVQSKSATQSQCDARSG